MEVWSGRRNRAARLAGVLALAILPAGPGCTIAPKRFADVADPAPLVRARAATLGDGLPAQVVVPALLARLDDADPVVRLTAHEELKRRTGQDFGYEPWADPRARAQAVARWRSWWADATRRTAAPTAPRIVRTAPAATRRATGRPAAPATPRARTPQSPTTTRIHQTLAQVPPTRR